MNKYTGTDLILVFCVVCIGIVLSQPPPGQVHMDQAQGQQQQGQPQHGGGGHGGHGGNVKFHDKNHIRDKEHIKEHLDGVASKDTADMSEEELQFHYFKLHDYDNNNKLDGIELISAMTHYHKDETVDEGMKMKDIEEMVDQVLEEDDRDRDGMINYMEFVRSQREDLVDV